MAAEEHAIRRLPADCESSRPSAGSWRRLSCALEREDIVNETAAARDSSADLFDETLEALLSQHACCTIGLRHGRRDHELESSEQCHGLGDDLLVALDARELQRLLVEPRPEPFVELARGAAI